MMIIRKSPNMMSTIGRMPVIAAPTPMRVKPASEIGVSMIRSLPNSSTRPVSTLNVVPASATSAPMRTTFGSRRISSAMASLMASPKVSSLTAVASSGIDVLVHLVRIGIGSVDGKLHGGIHLRNQLLLDGIESGAIGEAVVHHPLAVQRDRVALRHPLLFFGLRAVVGAGDVADVMSVVSVGLELQEGRSLPLARPLDVFRRGRVDVADVLAIDRLGGNPEGLGARADVARRRLREVRVLVVSVVLARKDHRKLPQLCQVELLVEQPLAEGALAEEADRDAILFQVLRRVRRAGRDAGAAADDRVGAKIAGRRVGDVHRAALALAVPGFLAQQLSEHQVRRCALGQAVPVTAMRARDVVVFPQCLAHADGDRLLADVEVREPGHQRPRVEIVDALLEQADGDHLLVQPQQRVGRDLRRGLRGGGAAHAWTPESLAITLNTAAQSLFSRPRPRAAVSISLATAVVGIATPSRRPRSSASVVSFCIIFMSNHASSGMSSTKGPRYWMSGDASTLFV